MAEPDDDLDVSEAEPDAAPAPIVEEGRVKVVSEDGKLGSVSQDRFDAFAAENPNARLATEGDLAQKARIEGQQGILKEVQTGVESGADLLTLGGLSTATRVVSPEAAADMRLRRELNPLAATTGEIAGTGLAAAMTLGGGGALGGAGAALRMSPAAVAMRAGVAVERLGAGGGLAARTAATAAAGALEGAVFGAGQGLSESMLDTDVDLTAERVLASMADRAGDAAMLGGLAAGAFPLMGAGVRRSGTALRNRLSSGSKQASGELAETAAAGAARTPMQTAKAIATAPARLADEMEAATRRITTLGSESQIAVDKFLDTATLSFKHGQAAKLMKRTPPASFDGSLADAAGSFDGLRQKLQRFVDDPDLLAGSNNHGRRMIKQAVSDIDDATKRVNAAVDSAKDVGDRTTSQESLADVFGIIDGYKNKFGTLAKRAETGQNADHFAGPALRDLYETDLRQTLEDATIFGTDAADMQRAVNKQWSAYLDYSKGLSKRLMESSSDATVKGADPFTKVRGVDSNKAAAIVRGFGEAGSTTQDNLVVEGLSRQADLVKEMAERYEVPAAMKAAATKARSAADEVKATLDGVRRTRDDGEKWKTFAGLADAVPFVDGGKLARGVGTVANLAVNGASRLAGISGAAGATQGRIGKAVKGLLGRRGSVTGAAVGAAEDGGNKRTRYRKIHAAVREFEHDPKSAVRRSLRNAGDVGSVAPVLAGAMAAKTVQAASYLSEKLPRSQIRASLTPQDIDAPPELSAAELDEFMQHAQGALDPASVAEDIEQGNITPAKVEALRTVWPSIYADMQDQIMREMDAAEEPPPYKLRLELGLLFDVPTDPSLEGDYVRTMQAAAAGPLPSDETGEPLLSPSQRSAPDLAGDAQTKSEQIASR